MRLMQCSEKPSTIVKGPFFSKHAAASLPTRSLLLRADLPTAMPAAQITDPPLAVLDTNVVLDLWLFDDPRATALRQALQGGHLQAMVTPAMLAELADVLQRPFVRAWAVPAAQVVAALQACSRVVEPAVQVSPTAPRCSDADDQKFIDQAWACAVPWLLSRDRALLRLARPALGRGLRILTPEAWAATNPSADGLAKAVRAA